MSGVLDPVLAAVRLPWGGQRFFAPGDHPAIQRLRMERSALLPYSETVPNARLALEYVSRQIAMFEEGESEAKQRYLGQATR